MTAPTNVIITGAAGRMGKRLIALAAESPTIQLTGATEATGHPALGQDAGEVAGCGRLAVPITDHLARLLSTPAVIVDFTTPVATLEHMAQAVQHNRAMVIGTTGLDPAAMDQLRQSTQAIPCVHAPNMSAGITILLQIVGTIAQALGDDYDIEVIEAHHKKKNDAPSGTALHLAQVLAHAKGWDTEATNIYARHGLIGERAQQEIGVQSLRAGDIVGDHTILYGGLGERIEITHRAHNRDTFARGGLRAAQWVATQPPGFYTMADVLGLEHSLSVTHKA